MSIILTKLDIGNFFTVDAKTDFGGVVYGERIESNDSYYADLKFGGIIPVKSVKVSVVENLKVVPGGQCIGVKLHTEGLLVVGVASFARFDGNMVSPARDAGIRQGDLVKEVDGNIVDKASDFASVVEKSGGKPVTVTVKRDGEMHQYSVTPCLDGNNKLKLGIWVRSSVAGIGTLTFYNPQTKKYGALGHGITDSDTGEVVPIEKGEILDAEIVSVVKGQRGIPGELRGSFSGDDKIGTVENNTECGIYGTASDEKLFGSEALDVASRSEVKEGSAQILSSIDGVDVKAYDIEIQRVSHQRYAEKKCMIIKVTDSELLNQTGGILQGMSGSPIIQNGKIVGAVTHVFVNDPTRGYGIFIENMLKIIE